LKKRLYKILLKLLLKAKKRKKIEFGSVCLIHKRCVYNIGAGVVVVIFFYYTFSFFCSASSINQKSTVFILYSQTLLLIIYFIEYVYLSVYP
jgi:hypothetical protein